MPNKTKIFNVSYSFLGSGDTYIRAKDEEEAQEIWRANQYPDINETIDKNYFEIYEVDETDLKQLPSEEQQDPQRGNLYHEIIKNTQRIEELARQTNNKAFQNQVKRSTNSIEKITSNYLKKNI